MTDANFPLMTKAALAGLERLGTPIFIYDFTTQRVSWSNAPALHFWNAETLAELLDRELTPYSKSTELRLEDYLAAFRRGQSVTESWTFYPKGVAMPTMSRCCGVSTEVSPIAMMVEIGPLTEGELPSAELRAIEALRHTSLNISMFSDSGEVLLRNPAAQALFGEYDERDKTNRDRFRAMFADPSDCDLLIEDAEATGQTAVRTATMAVDGLPIHAIQLTPVLDPVSGKSAKLVEQQDMTLLLRLSRQLAASEEALDAVLSLNVAPALVIGIENDAVLKSNFAAQALLGGLDGPAGGAMQGFVDPEQYRSVRETILTNGAGTAPMQMYRADGGIFWASVSGARITYDRKDALVVLVTDIDQLYQVATQLEAALDVERQTTEMQRRILAIAAHDLRTPLSIIDNTAQMLERHLEASTVSQTKARAVRIRGTVQRILRLLENTIESTQHNLPTLGYAPAFGDICATLSASAHAFAEAHPGLQITLDLPKLPPISFDQHLIEQALSNLLSNAVKYSGGAPKVDIRAIAKEAEIEILIRDQGIGIPEEDRDNVFSEYVRAGNVGDQPGTGLGLSIVQQIAKLHGGAVGLVPTEGSGTTIRLTLPRT